MTKNFVFHRVSGAQVITDQQACTLPLYGYRNDKEYHTTVNRCGRENWRSSVGVMRTPTAIQVCVAIQIPCSVAPSVEMHD